MRTRDLTYISIVLGLSVIFKFLTDILTRTVLFVFFIDPFLLTAVFILLKYPKFKVAIILAISQTVLSAMFFMATDMWFIRPFIVLLCFLSVKIIHKVKVSIEKKYMFASFLSSMSTIIMVSIVLIIIVLFMPNLFPMEEIQQQMALLSGNISEQGQDMMANDFLSLIIISLVVMAFIFSFIPATAHLLLALLISRVFKIEKKIFNVEIEKKS